MPVAGRAPTTTHNIQSVVEGAVELDNDNSIEFLGERFRLAESIGLMPLLAFAAASKKGLDSSDMDGLAAMYAMIRDCLDQTRTPAMDPNTGEPLVDSDGSPQYDGPSEWMRFEQHCYDTKADGEDLMGFISQAISVVSARPRKPRPTSSDGSRPTLQKSKVVSSPPVSRWPGAEDLTDVRELGR